MTWTPVLMVGAALAWVVAPIIATAEDYRYKNEELLGEVFGGNHESRIPPLSVDLGDMSLSAKTTLNCGKIGIDVNLKAQLNNLKDQFKGFVDYFKDPRFLLSLGMMELCNLYPKACAALRHDSLKLDNLLKARFDACQWIDSQIESSAERGRQELKADAIKRCVESRVNGGASVEDAVQGCQKEDGLLLKSFERWATGESTRGSQRTLQAIVNFGKKHAGRDHYQLYASLLGEIEVLPNGQWKPMFPDTYLYPEDFVAKEIALAQSCKTLESLLDGQARRDPREEALRRAAKRGLHRKYVLGIQRFERNDQTVICNLLGKAVALEAAKELAGSLTDLKAATKLHPAIPTQLKAEMIERADIAQQGILEAVENEGDLTVAEARRMVDGYASILEYRSKYVGTKAGAGSAASEEMKREQTATCHDEATCGGM